MSKKIFTIIGGGIIGSSIAREILMRNLGDVTILEKEKTLGEHASGRNSGVVHSGINQFPGTLKAKMCLEGSRILREYCLENKVKINQCGTLVVARNDKELQGLSNLHHLGKKAGVQGLKIIDYAELKAKEPDIVGVKALLSPSGAIVDSMGFLKSVAKYAKFLGAEYAMNSKVIKIKRNNKESKILTNNGSYTTDHIINCAGLYADKIAHMMDIANDYQIIPFRGEYMEVKNVKLNSMVYQIPDLRYPFLRVHLTRSIDNKVLAGPTATLSIGRESYRKQINFKDLIQMGTRINFWRLVLSQEFFKLAFHNAKLSLSSKAFRTEVQSLCKPILQNSDLIPFKSGIRAQMVDKNGKMIKDMLVEFTKTSTHILNAVSPGMTCSLAFAKYVVDKIQYD